MRKIQQRWGRRSWFLCWRRRRKRKRKKVGLWQDGVYFVWIVGTKYATLTHKIWECKCSLLYSLGAVRFPGNNVGLYQILWDQFLPCGICGSGDTWSCSCGGQVNSFRVVPPSTLTPPQKWPWSWCWYSNDIIVMRGRHDGCVVLGGDITIDVHVL